MTVLAPAARNWSTSVPSFYLPWGWLTAFAGCTLVATGLFARWRSPYTHEPGWALLGALAAGNGAVYCFSRLLGGISHGLGPLGELRGAVALAVVCGW